MKLSYQQLSDALYYAYNGSQQGTDKEYLDAMEAHEADALDIEGYERIEWTELDPDDPETYPPEGEYILLAVYNKHYKWDIYGGRPSKDFVDCWNKLSTLLSLKIFWRKVTSLPLKIEEK